MIVCPYCDHQNIEGVDECEACGLSLHELHLPTPASSIERSLLKDRIAVLAPKKPETASPGTKVSDALKLLVDKSIGCLLVVEHAKVVGIFSERDVLLKINTDAAAMADRPISDFMTASVETLQPTDKIAFAVQRMDLGGYRHVPLVDENGSPTGIISVRDILRYLTQKIAEETG